MKETLYSLRTNNGDYTITKIVDGEVESSYSCTERECTCPAGHRPSCRHRQMLPEMLARGLCDSMWFWNFDTHRVVDFNGELKSNLDAMNELAREVVGAAQHVEANEAPPQQQKPSWRRL